MCQCRRGGVSWGDWRGGTEESGNLDLYPVMTKIENLKIDRNLPINLSWRHVVARVAWASTCITVPGQ